MADIARTTSISEDLDLFSFVLDKDAIERIERLAFSAVAGQDDDLISEYAVRTVSNKNIEFDSFSSLLDYLQTEPRNVASVSLEHTKEEASGVRIVFGSSGDIELSGFSNTASFDFELDHLRQAILQSKQEYNWFVRSFLWEQWPLVFVFLLAMASLVLLFSVGYYSYARAVGINIDPTLIPSDNRFAERIADAVRSNDINKKLDVLLMAQLKDFTNVRDVLGEVGTAISIELFCIAVLIVAMVARKLLARLYPRSFFVFGNNEKVYRDLQTKRQVWGIAVGVAFVVNVIAGVVVAFMMKR
jgi:hypothetical protein